MIVINQADCQGCESCIEVCPHQAIHLVGDVARIDRARCDDCGICLDVCPHGAIMRQEVIVSRPADVIPALPTQVQRPGTLAAVGTALVTIGVEILPYLVDMLKQRANQRVTQTQPRPAARMYGETGRGGQRRQRSRRGGGPGEVCVCPACGYQRPHQAGVPRRTQVCPQCGGRLTRR